MSLIRAIALLAVLAGLAVPALADDIDQATLDQVRAIAVTGYAKPADAKIRNVHKSLARNGKGYCGEITVESAPDTYTAFHVLLETANGPSVLRLADFGDPAASDQAATVYQMMQNFGCIK